MQFARSQPGQHDGGSGHGRTARIRGTCLRPWTAGSRSAHRRGRQIRAAGGVHRPRSLGSAVSAGAVRRRRQRSSIRSGSFPGVLLEIATADRGCPPSSAALWNLLLDPRKDHGDRDPGVQDSDRGQGSGRAFCADNRLPARLAEAANARPGSASHDGRATQARHSHPAGPIHAHVRSVAGRSRDGRSSAQSSDRRTCMGCGRDDRARRVRRGLRHHRADAAQLRRQ